MFSCKHVNVWVKGYQWKQDFLWLMKVLSFKMLFVTKITTAHISDAKKNYNVIVYVAPFNLMLERERRELSKIPFILNLDSTISKIFFDFI